LSFAKRQQIADAWFSVMFARFKRDVRLSFNSDLAGDAERLCAKLKSATGQLTFEKILSETYGFLALSSRDRARTYFDFWSEIINRRQPLIRKTGS
jgi:hypothetical protein